MWVLARLVGVARPRCAKVQTGAFVWWMVHKVYIPGTLAKPEVADDTNENSGDDEQQHIALGQAGHGRIAANGIKLRILP